MKLLFIGDTDILAKSLVDSFAKEDYSVYIVSKNDFKKQLKPALNYSFFPLSTDSLVNEEVFLSVNPYAIIFAGENYLKSNWDFDSNLSNYSKNLHYWLEKSKVTKNFIYLSSTLVYGNNGQAVTEIAPVNPLNLKAITMLNSESLVKLYEKQYDVKTTILRCSDIFDNRISYSDFLSEMVEKVYKSESIEVYRNEFIQPIHVNDVSDAIKRLLQNGLQNKIYNVCSTKIYKMTQLYEFLIQKINSKCELKILLNDKSIKISNNKLKIDFEWVDFKDFIDLLKNFDYKIHFPSKEKGSTKKLNLFGVLKKGYEQTRKIIDNSVLFIIFFLIGYFTKDNNLFASIDWMIIYIILIAINYGMLHTTIAIVLASITHFLKSGLSFEQILYFYSYVDIIVKIILYIFVGVIVSYIVDMLKEELRVKSDENESLKLDNSEIKNINAKNILIKNEYERRLMSTKNSLPKLYSIISKINVLQPEKIFYEVLNITSDIMETDTVAVYITNKNSSYVRLIVALNQESIYAGKSWNLNNDTDIKEKIENGEIYIGDKWNNKPVFVTPVMHANECIAVIVIKNMMFEEQSLYKVNLLRTLSVLISDAISKAIDYENVMRANIYIEDTDILIYSEFIKKVALGYEKKRMNLGDCCVIKCELNLDDFENYELLKGMFRNTDVLGLDNDGKLNILLGNDSKDEAMFLIERLKKKNIIAEITNEFEHLGE